MPTPREDLFATLNKVYAEHPLTAATILERVRRTKGTLDDVSEADLCFDDESHLTDQNHSGGAAAVIDIAETVSVNEGMLVLDVGTGLGGAVRLLSQKYDCHCVGVELTEVRYRDALELTRLVRLDHLVTLIQGDFLTVELPAVRFDLVLGQGSFGHFPRKHQLMERCAAVLQPGGYLAMEEAVLLRPPAGLEEQADLDALSECWNCSFATFFEWTAWTNRAGFAVISQIDLSSVSRRGFQEGLRLAEQGRLPAVNALELRGWRLAENLGDRGLIGYGRLIGRKPV